MPKTDDGFPKLYRFMREYADYQKKKIKESENTDWEKDILLMRVDRFVMGYRRGNITVAETMRCLAELDYNIRYGLDDNE